MRTSRLSLAGTVIIALLGGLNGAVVAQTTDMAELPDGPASVTGTVFDGREHQGATKSLDADRARHRGVVYVDPIEMDDPRLSGAMWQAWSLDTLPDADGRYLTEQGSLISGTAEIVNEDGSWVGTLRGYIDPATRDIHYHAELGGTGAYNGYSALLYAKGPSTMDVEGFIFPGTLPGYPDPVEVPIAAVEVVVARRNAVAGYVVVPALRIVSAAEAGPDAFTDLLDVKGRIAAVDIPEGQPITPDMLEPPAE